MFTKILHNHSVRHFGFLCLQSKTSTTWIHIQLSSFTDICNRSKTRIYVEQCYCVDWLYRINVSHWQTQKSIYPKIQEKGTQYFIQWTSLYSFGVMFFFLPKILKMFSPVSSPTVIKRMTHASENKQVSNSWSGLRRFFLCKSLVTAWPRPALFIFCRI